MSEQVMNQFRSDRQLREDCVAIYESLGMDLNTAFRMFMERTRMVRGLPFPAVLPESKMTRADARNVIESLRREAADAPEFSLDEINAEITKHPDSPTALVVDAISEEKLIPLYNEEILEEYDDVLHRAKFPFSNDAIQNIMQMIRQFGLAISPSPTGVSQS